MTDGQRATLTGGTGVLPSQVREIQRAVLRAGSAAAVAARWCQGSRDVVVPVGPPLGPATDQGNETAVAGVGQNPAGGSDVLLKVAAPLRRLRGTDDVANELDTLPVHETVWLRSVTPRSQVVGAPE